jgi:hypothetical protein
MLHGEQASRGKAMLTQGLHQIFITELPGGFFKGGN